MCSLHLKLHTECTEHRNRLLGRRYLFFQNTTCDVCTNIKIRDKRLEMSGGSKTTGLENNMLYALK